MAGWLAGLPVVAGPILFFIAAEQGALFAAQAATVALSAVLASAAYSLAYSHLAQRSAWPVAMAAGLTGWCAADAGGHFRGTSLGQVWIGLLAVLVSVAIQMVTRRSAGGDGVRP